MEIIDISHEAVSTADEFALPNIGLLAVAEANAFIENQGFKDVPADVRTEIESRLVENDNLDASEAKLALDNSLIFLTALAENPGIRLSPSESVDLAWHHLILFTADYAEYCEDIAGRFLHHRPTRKGERRDELALSASATFDFLVDKGFEPDASVWVTKSTDCDGSCDGGGSCSGRCDGGCDGV